jgi:ParB family chromosome partitioning protein
VAPAAQALREVETQSIRANRSQPRTHFDPQALDELASSIREHGLIQPLIVAELPDGGYELIAGERRWRAAQQAGVARVPVVVKTATPQQLLELALVENIQRADLNPLEEGIAYQTLKDDFGLTDEAIARRVSKNRVSVVNTRRLIKLIPPAQQALLEGTISAGHGRALLRLEQPDQQGAALTLLLNRDLSVRELERLTELAVKPQLGATTRQALLAGTIVSAQAEALQRLEDHAQQARVLDTVLAEGLQARETERLCEALVEGVALDAALAHLRRANGRGAEPTLQRPPSSSAPRESADARPAARALSPEDAEVQRLFEEALATPVQLSRSGGSIRLTITVFTDEQLQGLYDLLSGG